jgi:hypothetical protein
MTLREEFLKPLYEDRELRLTVVKKLAMAISLRNSKDMAESSIQRNKKARGILK